MNIFKDVRSHFETLSKNFEMRPYTSDFNQLVWNDSGFTQAYFFKTPKICVHT